MFAAGIGAMGQVAHHNEIETLTSRDDGESYYMKRIPGADILSVERHLRDNHITSVWTTISLTYPLLFETGETLAISDAFFGLGRDVYPPSILPPQMRHDQPPVFVIESDSPLRPKVEKRMTEAAGKPPLVTEYGTLTVIQQY